MSETFDAFILFAEMRTGSNRLEQLINTASGVSCMGEVYNPTFIGHPKQSSLAGFDLAARERDPVGCFTAMVGATPDLVGFRFFHDHDPRILDRVMPDPRVAKVILRRNPLDSYISRKIATETGQWKLTDVKHRRAAKVHFDGAEFAAMARDWQGFYARLRVLLQRHGQAAFQLGYDDLNDTAAINGLLRYLGVEGEVDPSLSKLKPQNPAPAIEKVENPGEMQAALAQLDAFGLDQVLHANPGTSARVPQFCATPGGEVLFMPLPGNAAPEMRAALAQSAGVSTDDLAGGFDQRSLRAWYRSNPQHRRFTYVRHPLARAHALFCREVLPTNRPRFAPIRRMLRNRYDIPLPRADAWDDYTSAAHAAAFAAWLTFLKGCLAGQTSLIPPRSWGLQSDAVQALASVSAPDFILRESDHRFTLGDLAGLVGLAGAFEVQTQPDTPFALSEIYSGELDSLARKAYRRDYLLFGFSDWSAD